MNEGCKDYLDHQLNKLLKEIEGLYNLPDRNESGRNGIYILLSNVMNRLEGCQSEIKELYAQELAEIEEYDRSQSVALGYTKEKTVTNKRYEFNSLSHRINYIKKILINRELIDETDKAMVPELLRGVGRGAKLDDVQYLAEKVLDIDSFKSNLKTLDDTTKQF